MFENLSDVAAGLGSAAKAAGKGTAKLVSNIGGFASKHPMASSRLYGASQVLRSIADFKDFKETRNKGALITGIARVLVGGALVIYNDRKWYEKVKPITPALNTNRPMNPVLLTGFTDDPTMGGITKFIDLEMDWESLEGSLVFDTVSVQIMKGIREGLRSNLVYGDEHVRHYLNDAINLTIWMLQVQTQMAWRDLAQDDNPTAYRLVNKIADMDSTYGPVSLHGLADYDPDIDPDQFASTISIYDTLVSKLNANSVYLPGNLPEFLNFYFGNVYATDGDGKNTQLIFPRVRRVRMWNDNDTSLQYIDISNLRPADLLIAVQNFARKYAIIQADLTKVAGFTAVNFPYYNDLAEVAVYSPEFLQMVINGYTDADCVTDNGFVRLDYLDPSIDVLTTFMACRALQKTNDPLFTPAIRIKSMVVKFESNDDLKWDVDLFQGPYDTSKDFGLAINSHIFKDNYVNINRDNAKMAAVNGVVDYTGDLTPDKMDITVSTTESKVIMGDDLVSVQADADMANNYIIAPIAYVNVAKNESWGNRIIYALFDGADNSVAYYNMQNQTMNGMIGPKNQGKFVIISKEDYNSAKDNVVDVTASSDIYRYSLRKLYVEEGRFTFTNGTNSKFLQILGIPNPNISYVSMNLIFNEVVGQTVGTTVGFSNLDSFIADQVDFHLPIQSTTRSTVFLNGEIVSKSDEGTSLIKENYIPFMYNVHDLTPVLYDMFFSLMIARDIKHSSKNGKKDKKNNKNNNSNTKKKENKDSKPKDKQSGDDWPDK